jgi:hypothetical protein
MRQMHRRKRGPRHLPACDREHDYSLPDQGRRSSTDRSCGSSRKIWCGPGAGGPTLSPWRGDPSDRLPGVPGVGAKLAASLLQTYGSVEALLSAGRYADWAEELRLFRSIATMDRRAPLPKLRDQAPWRERLHLRENGTLSSSPTDWTHSPQQGAVLEA